MCVFVNYRAGQQILSAVSKGHSQRACIDNCRQPQQGILGRKTKTDAPMSVWLFSMIVKCSLKTRGLGYHFVFFVGTRLIMQQLFLRYLPWQAAKASETIFKLCHTQYILSTLCQLETQVWYLGMNWAQMSWGSGFCSTRYSVLLFHFGKQSTWQFTCRLWKAADLWNESRRNTVNKSQECTFLDALF